MREHIAAACNLKQISDPFMLWNDDFFAMRPVGDIPLYHGGPMHAMVTKVANAKTPWARGLRATNEFLHDWNFENPLTYDIHLPLIVYKRAMREALRWSRDSGVDGIHTRTIYGNILNREGVYHLDPKMDRTTEPFPPGSWLSSSSRTFRPTIEPVLRYVFPNKSRYEE